VYEVQSILLRYGGHVLKKTPVVVAHVKKKIEEHKQREEMLNSNSTQICYVDFFEWHCHHATFCCKTSKFVR
jgi:hypothetical protein